MSLVASSSHPIDGRGTPAGAGRGKIAITLILGIVFAVAPVMFESDARIAPAMNALVHTELDSSAVVLIPRANFPTDNSAPAEALQTDDTQSSPSDENAVPTGTDDLPPAPVAAPKENLLPPFRLAATHKHESAEPDSRLQLLPTFAATYRAVLKQIAASQLQRLQVYAAFTSAAIVGTASTYNPYRDRKEAKDTEAPQTASGETYDPEAWTAAIQVELRERCGGVRYGKMYQPAFALVVSGEKQVIVRINDVGPLKPGRVIDLNERSMRYFDPFMERGLLPDASITFLPGEQWVPGPVHGEPLVSLASKQ